MEQALAAISAVSAAIAAIGALIAAFQNHTSIKRVEQERHANVKPIFIVRSTMEDRAEKHIEINIKNIGFDKFNSLNTLWSGDSEDMVKIKINRIFNSNDEDCIIFFDFSAVELKEKLEGKIMLSYFNVLGKKYIEGLNIKINNKYYEMVDEYNPELESIGNKQFA